MSEGNRARCLEIADRLDGSCAFPSLSLSLLRVCVCVCFCKERVRDEKKDQRTERTVRVEAGRACVCWGTDVTPPLVCVFSR